MRWPFARSVPSVPLEMYERHIADWRAQYAKAMEHNRELVRQIVTMKREGFVVQPPPTVVPPVVESESDKAIREIAGRNGGLRRHLIQWRDTQRAEGKEEKTLADEIRHWRGGDTESAD